MPKEYRKMIVASEAMRDVQRKIDMLAPYDTNVLVLGETGTGKELVARQIHDKSRRSEYRFEAINTGALPRELVESELFGYERGAFTGAHGRKLGYFELANRGTLFLDEIGNMPPETQVKLLRALDAGTFRPVGGITDQQTDVRIISATNSPDIYNSQNFRVDLLYRLAVDVIEVPQLRRRRDDVGPIATEFLKQWNEKNGCEKCLDPASLKLLLEYDYPGNVRQLQNILESACVESASSTIDQFTIRKILDEQRKHVNHGYRAEIGNVVSLSYRDARKTFVLDYMRRIFEFCGGNVILASRKLMNDVGFDEVARDLGYDGLEDMIGDAKEKYVSGAPAEIEHKKTKPNRRRSNDELRKELIEAFREHGPRFIPVAESLGISDGALDVRIRKLGYKGREDFRRSIGLPTQ